MKKNESAPLALFSYFRVTEVGDTSNAEMKQIKRGDILRLTTPVFQDNSASNGYYAGTLNVAVFRDLILVHAFCITFNYFNKAYQRGFVLIPLQLEELIEMRDYFG
jgi:hypothetical protein